MGVDTPQAQSRVAAIVLNWKDPVSTVECVRTLAAQSELGEILVVDNESDGNLRQELPAGVALIEEPANRGFAGGINRAFNTDLPERFEYLLIINNDATSHDGLVVALAEHLDRHPNVGMVGAVLLNPDGSIQSTGGKLNALRGTLVQSKDPAGPVDYLSWACVLLRSKALREIGGLDEGYFMYVEDVEYALRMRRAGWDVELVPQATVTHALSASGAHARSLLVSYYAWALVWFARTQPWKWKWFAAVRLAGIMLRRALRRDAVGLRALLKGISVGVRTGTPAFEARSRYFA